MTNSPSLNFCPDIQLASMSIGTTANVNQSSFSLNTCSIEIRNKTVTTVSKVLNIASQQFDNIYIKPK